MNQKDNVDLSSVNKTKKKLNLPKLTNLLRKKHAGPSRDADGKFASVGGGGLRFVKRFDWKRTLPVVIIIALTGGFFVWKSFAASPQFDYSKCPYQQSPRQTQKADELPLEGGKRCWERFLKYGLRLDTPTSEVLKRIKALEAYDRAHPNSTTSSTSTQGSSQASSGTFDYSKCPYQQSPRQTQKADELPLEGGKRCWERFLKYGLRLDTPTSEVLKRIKALEAYDRAHPNSTTSSTSTQGSSQASSGTFDYSKCPYQQSPRQTQKADELPLEGGKRCWERFLKYGLRLDTPTSEVLKRIKALEAYDRAHPTKR